MRVVAEDAKLLSGFIPIGLHPGGGQTALLSRLGSREAAAALTLFGERLTGAQAVEHGLAWAAVPDAEVDDAALALAAVPARHQLARRTAASLRTVTGPPALPWGRRARARAREPDVVDAAPRGTPRRAESAPTRPQAEFARTRRAQTRSIQREEPARASWRGSRGSAAIRASRWRWTISAELKRTAKPALKVRNACTR